MGVRGLPNEGEAVGRCAICGRVVMEGEVHALISRDLYLEVNTGGEEPPERIMVGTERCLVFCKDCAADPRQVLVHTALLLYGREEIEGVDEEQREALLTAAHGELSDAWALALPSPYWMDSAAELDRLEDEIEAAGVEWYPGLVFRFLLAGNKRAVVEETDSLEGLLPDTALQAYEEAGSSCELLYRHSPRGGEALIFRRGLSPVRQAALLCHLMGILGKPPLFWNLADSTPSADAGEEAAHEE